MKLFFAMASSLHLEAAASCTCGSRYPTCESDGFCYDHHAWSPKCMWPSCCGGDAPCTASAGAAAPALPPAPPMSADERVCASAYSARCYDHPPFDQCCGVCSGGSQNYQCDWYFRDRVTDCEDCGDHDIRDSFTWTAEQTSACERACGAFGGERGEVSHFLDYCPGGLVWEAVQGCPSAKASLKRLIPPSMCPRYDGAEFCNWEFHKVVSGGTDHSSTVIVNGTFAFTAGDTQCKAACTRLGVNTNTPASYCSGEVLTGALRAACPEAQRSLTNALHGASGWCPEPQIELTAIPQAGSVVKKIELDSDDAPRSLRSIDQTAAAPTFLVNDQQCHAAWYDHHCYDKTDDWRSCCDSCGVAVHAALACSWEYTGPGGTHVQGSFNYPVTLNTGCTALCVHLANTDNMPVDFCAGGRLYDLSNTCPIGQHSLVSAVEGTNFCNAAASPISLIAQRAPMQVPVMSACAGVAALVAFAAFARPRRHADSDHTEQLLDNQ